MFAVVFEVHPAAGRKDEYLGLAARLKPILETIDGFLDNERFESQRRPGWMLSLSTWRDEKSVVRWRGRGEHHVTQGRGRAGVFSDYRLRVCEVTADTNPPAGLAVVEQRFDETEIGVARTLTITEVTPAPGAAPNADTNGFAASLGLGVGAEGLVDHDVFESIANPGKRLLLTAWRDAHLAGAWGPNPLPGMGGTRHRVLRNIREYGMFDRREAPQYHPPAASAGDPG